MKLQSVEFLHDVRPFGGRRTFDPTGNVSDRGITIDYNPAQRLVRVARPGKPAVFVPTEAVAWMVIAEEEPAKEAGKVMVQTPEGQRPATPEEIAAFAASATFSARDGRKVAK